MEDNRIKLTTHQANTLRGAITERGQLQTLLQAKEAELNRLTTLFVLEAGIDPEQFQVEGVQDTKGETFLKLKAAPAAPPAPGE